MGVSSSTVSKNEEMYTDHSSNLSIVDTYDEIQNQLNAGGSRIQNLKPDDLKKFIKKKAMVLYYAPWCDFCQDFKPTYKKLSEELSNVQFGKINSDRYLDDVNDIRKKDLEGYPLVVLYANGASREISDDELTYAKIKKIAKAYYKY
jgi:thiol-disulfide isomerase/thioredoxin